MNFNVTKETRGSSINPIAAPVFIGTNVDPLFPLGYKFPKGSLVNVVFEKEKEMTIDGEKVKQPMISFIFKEQGKENQSIKAFFPVRDTADDVQKEQDAMNQYIKHFWDETIGAEFMPEEGLAPKATNYTEFFKSVADNFNKVVIEESVSGSESPKQVKRYSRSLIYIKNTYYQSNLQWPKFPNVIQKAFIGGKGVPCELQINPTYDKLQATAAPINVGGANFTPDTTINDVFPGDGLPNI
jgi:menaquinone-dependent protoporphyrinogen IX oxidase